MPKSKTSSPKSISYYSTFPWKCRHEKDSSSIVAYVEASAKWEVISIVRNTSGACAENLSNFICNLINNNQKNINLLNAAMEALELCLNEANLTFASEQAADSALHLIRKSNS